VKFKSVGRTETDFFMEKERGYKGEPKDTLHEALEKESGNRVRTGGGRKMIVGVNECGVCLFLEKKETKYYF